MYILAYICGYPQNPMYHDAEKMNIMWPDKPYMRDRGIE